MEKPCELQWHKFTAKSMPPYKENILVWTGLADSDGGFPVIGKLYHDSISDEDYIRHKLDCNGGGDCILQRDFRQCLWAEIPWPEKARRKWEKEREAIRRNMEAKEARAARRRSKNTIREDG